MTLISNVCKGNANRVNVNMVVRSEGVNYWYYSVWHFEDEVASTRQVSLVGWLSSKKTFQFLFWFYHQSLVFKGCFKSLFHFAINLVVPYVIILISLRGAPDCSSILPSCSGPCRGCILCPPLINCYNFSFLIRASI